MTQSGAYQHQSRMAIGKSAYYARPAPDLAIQTLNGVVGTDFLPVLGRKNPYMSAFLLYYRRSFFEASFSFMFRVLLQPLPPFSGLLLYSPVHELL